MQKTKENPPTPLAGVRACDEKVPGEKEREKRQREKTEGKDREKRK